VRGEEVLRNCSFEQVSRCLKRGKVFPFLNENHVCLIAWCFGLVVDHVAHLPCFFVLFFTFPGRSECGLACGVSYLGEGASFCFVCFCFIHLF
jgi:hypothetical protein